MIDTFNSELDVVCQILHDMDARAFDFQQLMQSFTFDSIGKIAFGVDVGCLHNQDTANFAKDFDFCTAMVNDSIVNPGWFLTRYFSLRGLNFFLAVRRLNRYAFKLIEDRKSAIESGKFDLDEAGDLLSLYLSKQGMTESDDSGRSQSDKSSSGKSAYLEPTTRNLRDVIVNFIIAGAFAATVYCLTKHDDSR